MNRLRLWLMVLCGAAAAFPVRAQYGFPSFADLAEKLIPSKQHLDEDEFLNVEAHELDELVQMILDGRITDGKTIAALLAYKVKRGR